MKAKKFFLYNIPLLFSIFIISCQKEYPFQNEFLTKCAVYILEKDRPVYKNIVEEGDITFYGILLLANKDPEILKYLFSKKIENIWEYQRFYGYSPVDTAWVIEALLNFGPDQKDQIGKTLSYMTNNDYDEKTGAFIGMKQGFSPYFLGPDLDATSHVSFLMGKFDFNKYKNILIKTKGFIKKNQGHAGLWKSRWYSSTLLSTYLAIRALSLFPKENSNIIDIGIKQIKNLQLKNGSIENSVLETSLAVLTFKEVGCCKENILKAKKWLLENKKNYSGPFLFYWLEQKNEKVFYDCWDKGKITEAFRTMALWD